MADFLQSLISSLQPLAQQDTAYRQNQHMNKVFAANPAFGQALYGAQNEQRTLGLQEEEIMRKRRQQEALKALASQLEGQPLDRQKALTQYGMITGDLEPLLGVGSGSLPAPIQIANEIARRRAMGDVEGAKLLELSAKLGEKGTYTDPLTGEVKVIPGYAPAVATIEGAKADAGNISDMTYDPITAGKTEAAKLGQQLAVEPEIAAATTTARLGAEKTAEMPKAQARLAATLAKSKNVMDTIDRAISKVGPTTAGFGSLVSGIPTTGAKDLSADIKTIKANMGFDELQEMRNNSPTGGALGQVAVQEIEFLQSVVSNLDQAQSPEQLKQQLQLAKIAKIESDKRIKAAFEAEYNAQSGGPTAQETPRQKLERLRRERGGQ